MARRPTTQRDQRGRMRIRSRLALLLIVPLVGLLGVTAFQVTNAVQQSREATDLKSGAELGLASYQLIDALQAERQLLAADQPVTPETGAAVDAASAEVRSRAAAEGGALQAMATRALSRTEGASALASTNTGGIVAVDGYSPAIDDLLVLSRASFDPGDSVDDAPAATTDFLAEAQEAAARERDLITSLAADQALVPEQFQDVTALASGQGILAEQAAAVATPALQVRIDRINDGLAAASTGRDALFFSTVEADDLTAWLSGADARVEDLRTLRDDAATLAVAAVDDLAASARRVLILSALAVVATVLISALLVRSGTRSIARPLQELATQAEEVALSRLPDAVRAQQSEDTDVHLPALRATGASEVREVAAAFNDVQETALRLAGEQAVLRRNLGDALTNLGRRNQALLGRQLDFISSLEKRETDPAFLDHLFKLDHLASRMRRNAESLLILAGSETPRRRRKPAEVAEIVRAAMSEVEDFERVRLGHLGRATLGGPVVIDLVHLLAELIENALGFSPPDTTVEVDGRSLGQGGYQLAVIDHGVGMSDVELVAANHRLAGLDEVDGMPTRYLGQYVIAKLAAKIGALVRLQPSTGGRGVTAVVSLPATAVMGATDRSNIAQPLPGSRAAREQGPVPFAPGAGIAAGSAQPEPVIDPDADPFAEPVPTIAELEPTAWGNVPGTFEDAAPLDELPALPAATVAGLDTSGLEGADPTSLWPSPSTEVPVPEPVLPVPAVTEPWAAPDPAFSDPGDADAFGAEPVPTDSWTLSDPATADLARDELTTDELVDDELATDELVDDGLATDELVDDGLVTDELATDELVDDGLVDDGLATADLAAEGSTAFEPVVSDPWGRPDPWVAPTVEEDVPSGEFVAEVDGGAPPPPPDPAVEQQAWSVPVQEWTAPVDEPAEAPVQSWMAPVDAPAEPAPAWSPVPGEPSAAVPSAAADALFAPLAPKAAESFTPIEPDIAPPEADGPGLGGGLGGGLVKRVPGASLADSPLGEPAPEPVPAGTRSPDEVRSMLSSFQTGRHRGLDGVAVSGDDQLPAPPAWPDEPAAMQHTDAVPATDWEDSP